MMSLQSSMHSSQMYTVGPAMSLRTSFWLLPQNEHLSEPPPSRVRAIVGSLGGRPRRHDHLGHGPGRRLGGDDLVDDPVLLRLLRRHEEVAVGVALDLVHRLARVVHEDAVQLLPHPEDLPRLAVDEGGMTQLAAE